MKAYRYFFSLVLASTLLVASQAKSEESSQNVTYTVNWTAANCPGNATGVDFNGYSQMGSSGYFTNVSPNSYSIRAQCGNVNQEQQVTVIDRDVYVNFNF